MQKTLLDLARKHGLSVLAEHLERVDGPLELHIGFLGEFSAGKSTLINALIGRKVLPALDTPTSAAIVEVLPREGLEGLRYFRRAPDGTTESISAVEFSDLATGRWSGVGVVEVPANESMREGFRLVDTPGLASLDETHADITFGYLPLLDGAVICVDLDQGGLSRSVLRFLQRPEVSALTDVFAVALCRADQKPSQQARDAVRAAAIAQLAEAAGTNGDCAAPWEHRVVAVAALPALEGRDGGDLDGFRNLFGRLFIEPKRELTAKRQDARRREIGHEMLDSLRDMRNNLSLDAPELEAKKRSLLAEVGEIEERREEHRRRLERVGEQLRAALLQIARDHAPGLEAAAGEELVQRCQLLTDELTAAVQTRVERHFEDFHVPELRHIGDAVRSRIETIMQATEVGKTVTTAILVAAVVPSAAPAANLLEGAGGAAASALGGQQGRTPQPRTAPANWVDRMADTGTRALRSVGGMLRELNPVEHLGNLVSHAVKKATLQPLLERLARSAADHLVVELEQLTEERVFDPLERTLRQKQETLTETRRAVRERQDQLAGVREELGRDIVRLGGLLARR